jgi:hypothetical protein
MRNIVPGWGSAAVEQLGEVTSTRIFWPNKVAVVADTRKEGLANPTLGASGRMRIFW